MCAPGFVAGKPQRHLGRGPWIARRERRADEFRVDVVNLPR
jgi:hypothetical protein